MIRTIVSGLISVLLTVLLTRLSHADYKENTSSHSLEVTKSTQKLEVRESQIGYRDTLLFYTFPEQNAVLKLQIGNNDKSFTMAGTIYIFADSVKEDDLKKWLNNQHSDGLFPEVPEPISTHKIPEKACIVTSHRMIDRSKQEFGEYNNYSVTFDVKDYADKKSITLKGFSDTAKVHVKIK